MYSLGRQVVNQILLNVFREFHRLLGVQASKQAENILQNLSHNLPPQTVHCVSSPSVKMSCYVFYVKIPVTNEAVQ